MRWTLIFLVSAVSVLVLPACYHATIQTGATPGPVRIEERWASAWVAGLVPPATVETMGQCPAGVAWVETRLSFSNRLVAILTAGVYTPMQITVTCASTAREDRSDVVEARSPTEARALLKSGRPFLIRIE